MARSFNASSYYASRTSGVVDFKSTGVTVMARINPGSSTPGASRVVFGLGNSGNANPLFYFGQLAVTGYAFMQVRDTAGTGGATISSTTQLTASTWFTLGAATDGGSDHEVYVNGASVGTSSTALGATTAPDRTAVGVLLRATAAAHWGGDIAEVAVWTGKLPDEAHEWFNDLASPLEIVPAQLVDYWKFMGNGSPEPDCVSGYDLTLTGPPTKSVHPRVRYPKPSRTMRSIYTAPAGGLSIPIAAYHYNHHLGSMAS